MSLQNLIKNKFFLLTLFLILCIVIASALYYLFFKPEPLDITLTPEEKAENQGLLPISGDRESDSETSDTTTNIPQTGDITRREATDPSTQISETAVGGVTKVSKLDGNKTSFINMDRSGNKLLSYNKNSGEFYKIDNSGNKTKYSTQKFKNVSNVTWAKDTEKAILEFPDGSNIYYDFKKDKQVTLPKTWTEFDFNNTESKIAYKDKNSNPDKRFIGTANPDGSGAKYIEYIGGKDNEVTVKWSPTGQIAATYNTGGNSDFSKLYFIGQNKENFRAIDINGYNVEYQYSPTGSHLIYSAQNSTTGHTPVLNIVEAAGDRIGYGHTSLKLQTWSDKCTFANKSTMYCAVPKEMPEGAGWFRELTDDIGDNIYKVDLETNSVSFVAQPQYEYNINQMQVNEDGSTLFFTDKLSQSLHKIQLK
jgi:hypothetical protein